MVCRTVINLNRDLNVGINKKTPIENAQRLELYVHCISVFLTLIVTF